MKQIQGYGLLGVLALVLAIPNRGICENEPDILTFHRVANGYTISLPAGWVQIPDEAVKQVRREWERSPGSDPTLRDGAFHQAGVAYPSMIVFVVQYENGEQPSTSESDIAATVKAMSGLDLHAEMNKQLNPDAAKLVSKASFGQLQWDGKNKILRMPLQVEVAGVGTVKGFTTSHFGRHAMISLACYEIGTDAGAEAIFNQINDSFRFDSGWEYDDRQHAAPVKTAPAASAGALQGPAPVAYSGSPWTPPAGNDDLRVLWAAICGFLKGCLILFGVWLLRRWIRFFFAARPAAEAENGKTYGSDATDSIKAHATDA